MDNFKKEFSELLNAVYFDPHNFLRETCSDPERLTHLIQKGDVLLRSTTDEADIYFLQSTLGNLCRIQGDYEQSCSHLKKCLDYAVLSEDTGKEITTLIRFGEALKYSNQHGEALALFDRAITKSCGFKHGVLDFALQHKGKCLMEINKLDKAEAYLLEALQLRQKKQDPSLIDSTRQAIMLLTALQKS